MPTPLSGPGRTTGKSTPNHTMSGLFLGHAASEVGSNFGFADGSVRFLKERIKPATLRALLSRNGGEIISPDDF